jgi:hypothetical protein
MREHFGLSIDIATHIQRGLNDGSLDRTHYEGYLGKLLGIGEADARGQSNRENSSNTADHSKDAETFEDAAFSIEDRRHGRLLKGKKWDPNSKYGRMIAVADAIADRIDRKTTEWRLQALNKKGMKRGNFLRAANLTPTPEEMQTLKSRLEIVIHHKSDGRLNLVRRGSTTNYDIRFTIEPGDFISHNHPSGGGPSSEDLLSILKTPGITWRILTINEFKKVEIFSVMAAQSLPDEVIKSIAKSYERTCMAQGDTPEARRKAFTLLSTVTQGILLTDHRELP